MKQASSSKSGKAVNSAHSRKIRTSAGRSCQVATDVPVAPMVLFAIRIEDTLDVVVTAPVCNADFAGLQELEGPPLGYHSAAVAVRHVAMANPGLKALLAIWSFGKKTKSRPDRDRIILILSVALTLGLFALYVHTR
jgi:hypothetical protein